jgi:FKBP-type peptidyl-prolyl cis-trans isomerase 2
MAEKIKKNDFVELEYTGMIAEDKLVFDTSEKEVAKKHHIHSEKHDYQPIIICIGQHNIVKGLDEFLADKELGQDYEVELTPENAFGKKDIKLIKLIPTSSFTKQNIRPMPGLQVDIDGMMGLVKTVAGGRTIVDFNHPLSGKAVIYKVHPKRIVTDDKEKVEAFISLELGLKKGTFETEVKEGQATITSKLNIPPEIHNIIEKKLEHYIPHIKKLAFVAKGKQEEHVIE